MPNNDLDKIAKAFSSASKTSSSGSKKNASSGTKSSSSTKNYWGKNYYKNPNLNNGSTSKNTQSSVKTSSQSKTTTKPKTQSSVTSSAVNKGLNNVISNTVTNSGLSSSQSGTINKEIKKLPVKSKICIVLLFIIGVLISLGSCYHICRNDQFEIVGKKTITLNINDSYLDAGAKAIAFSKNISSEIKIEVFKDGNIVEIDPNELDTSAECVYQIFYKLNNFRFRDVKIARTIIVISPEEVPPEEDAYDDETNVATALSVKF